MLAAYEHALTVHEGSDERWVIPFVLFETAKQAAHKKESNHERMRTEHDLLNREHFALKFPSPLSQQMANTVVHRPNGESRTGRLAMAHQPVCSIGPTRSLFACCQRAD